MPGQSRSKGGRSASKGRSRTPKQTVIFAKDTVIAIPGQDHGTNFRLAKLTQNVFESTKKVTVEFLKRIADEVLQKVFVTEEVTSALPVEDIIDEADVSVYTKAFKKKEAKKTCYELRPSSFLKLKKQAQTRKGATAKADDEDDDEEESSEEEEDAEGDDEEDEEEAEEEEKPRQVKKVTGRKTDAKKDEEEPKAEVRRSTRNKSSTADDKEAEVSRDAKKQKTTQKTEKATKKDDIDKEEEEEEQEEAKEPEKKAKGRPKGSGKKAQKDDEIDVEDEGDKTKTKAKAAGKGKKKGDGEAEDEDGEDGKKKGKKKDGTATKEKKPREKKKPTEYKKGKWNPNVEIVEVDETLESKDNQPIDYGSYKQNNRNLIRAVNTQNYKLLENCFAKDNFFSNLYARWSVDTDYNAIELAFMKNDKKAIQLFCSAYADAKKSPKLLNDPPSSFNAFNTGANSKFAYGVATRRVEMGRGGRELTNAYIKDQERYEAFDDETIKKILEVCDDTSLLDILRVDVSKVDPNQPYQYNPLSNIEDMMYQNFEAAVLSGNIKVAAYLAKIMTKNQGYGLAPMHSEVLIKTDHKKLPGNYKRPSYVAKIYGSNITPVHLACINPNAKILESVLSMAAEYSITDQKMRKPVHYAAACQSPDPLKLLLKHNVDFREGDREKMTPLMVAAKFGRVQNVEALLATGEKLIITQKNKEGDTAIHLAAQRGHLDVLKLFHKHEAKIDAPGKHRLTPLAQAAAHGHFDCVQWLVENKAKVIKKDKFKKSVLIQAVLNGHVKIVTYLLQNGAEFAGPDSSDITPIHYAAAYGFPDLIDILLKAGATQNVGDSQKLTPLAVAMLKNNNAVMKKLLSYPDTDVNCRDDHGRSLIMVALSTLNRINVDHVKFLLVEKGADPNVKDLKGDSALNLVCSLNVDNLVNHDGRLFQVYDQTQRQKLVEEIKAELQQLQAEVIKLLLDNKAVLNEPNNAGLTPFYTALQSSNFYVCDILLQHEDLDISIVSAKDESIYHILANTITEEKGLALFNTVIKKLGGKNNLASLVDENGFTPFLRVVQTFSNNAPAVFQTYTSTTQQKKLAEKQKKWDEDQQKKQQKKIKMESKANEGVKGRGRPSAKMAATSAVKSQPYSGGLFGATPAFGNDPNDSRPVSLTPEELTQVKEEANKLFNTFVENMITACKTLIAAGANPGETVQKLKKYRGDKGRASSKTPEATQITLLGQIGTNSSKRNKHSMFGMSHGHLFNQTHHTQGASADKLRSEYEIEGHQNALHLLQSFPHPRFMNFLLEFSASGLDINHQDHLDRTPLHYFIVQNSNKIGEDIESEDILRLFIEAKANLNLTDGAKNTPLFLSIALSRFHFTALLIKAGANINIVNKEGDSPLLHCVKNNLLTQADELLKAGADPNLPDKMHRSALHHSLNRSKLATDASFEMEATLLRFGANINALDERGRTALHYAFITIGNPFDYSPIDPVEVVTSLCSQKACDVHVKDRWGSTALHYAAQRGAQVCVLTLLKKGAKVDVVDNDGNTPLAVALHAKHAETAIMLIQSGSDVNSLIHVKEKKPENDNEKTEKKGKEAAKKTVEAMDVENGAEDEEKMDEEQVGGEEGEDENEEVEEDEVAEDIVDETDVPGDDGNDHYDEDEDENSEDDDDEEEDEDEEDYGGYNRNTMFQKQHHYGGRNNILDLPVGEYSMFTVAIRRDYQGVAYLMLQHGYDLARAIGDSMNENKMNYVWTLLTKVKDQSALQRLNESGQNIFHTFAQKGRSSPAVLTKKIYTSLIHNKVDFNIKDNTGKTPLHYAAAGAFRALMEELIKNGADINAQDNDGHTPFTLQLITNPDAISSFVDLYIANKADFQLRFTTKSNGEDLEMGTLTYLISKGNRNIDLLRLLITNGLSVNETDENGDNGLIHAIKQNSTRLVKFLLSFPNLDKTVNTSDKKTPIHCVVNSLEYGSFENTEILELLAPHFDINATDGKGKAPIYYAYLQDSGTMVEKLKELGAVDNKPAANIKRGVTSVVGNIDWDDEDVPYEEDAEKFITEKRKEQDDKIDEEDKKVQPDQYAGVQHGHTEVLYDENLGAYDLYMTKVDIEKGPYGGYVFYRMQILHSKLRDVYELLTRYGRIGDMGQVQKTPMDKEVAIQEFKKIFKSKTGNEWEEKETFTRVPGKYRLLKFAKRVNHKEYLTQFDLKGSKVPKANIGDEAIVKIMKDITSVDMYHRALRSYDIDTNTFTLATLEKSFLNEAQDLLIELLEVIKDIELEEKKSFDDRDSKAIIELQEKTVEKTNKYYELIPSEQFKTEAIQRIQSKDEVSNKLRIVNDLLDFEVSSKILLGALSKNYQVNPLDYCFKALNIKLLKLPLDNPEALVIKKYIEGSHGPVADGYIQNVFALERRGEAERISQWKHLKNKTLLWHGSKLANFMGIFAQGLRIAPSEAGSSGERGLFFADMFTVSSGYCDHSGGYKMLLLCEVALGDIFETRETEADIEAIQAPYKSVKALGKRGPRKDKRIVMPNGCMVPVGKVVDYYEGKKHEERPVLSESEYIVYDLSQVRIRYLVQTK